MVSGGGGGGGKGGSGQGRREGGKEGGREGGRAGLLTEVDEDGGEEEEVEHEDGGCQDAAHDALRCRGREGERVRVNIKRNLSEGRKGRRERGGPSPTEHANDAVDDGGDTGQEDKREGVVEKVQAPSETDQKGGQAREEDGRDDPEGDQVREKLSKYEKGKKRERGREREGARRVVVKNVHVSISPPSVPPSVPPSLPPSLPPSILTLAVK